MKIIGIIAEYNPFHNGHKYQIEKAKEISEADYVIVVISGNFVQRGAPAVFDKSIRVEMALNAGVDAIFEIPSFFSASSAADFAAYSISLLNMLGADYISFGAENNDYKILDCLADILAKGNIEKFIKKYMSKGLNYARARHNAIKEELREKPDCDIDAIENVLASPNNILAIEYLKNIKLKHVYIKPVIISRVGSGYHEKEIDNAKFLSATAIRQEIFNQDSESFLKGVPKKNYNVFKSAKAVFENDFLFTIQRSILEKIYRGEDLSKYCDISEELANTIIKKICNPVSNSFNDFILSLKSKNYTYTRISRGIFHLLLNHLKTDLEEIKADENMCAYIRLLGFREESRELLSELKKRTELPIISKMSNAGNLLNEKTVKIFKNNIYSDFLYNSIYFEKYGEELENPYRKNIVTV